MVENSRVKNSVKNMKFGMAYQVVYLLLNFIVRFSIIKVLGVTALSLNGLFTEVLSILSLAEMGVGTAITYCLYKPLAEGDEKKITQLMGLFRTAYHIISLIMLAVGLALIPLLPYIVTKVDVSRGYLTLIYVLFLLQTVASYVNSYKALLLTADQKAWVQAKINVIVRTLLFAGSLAIIFITKNFVLYVINEALYTFVFYFIVGKQVDKMYPYIKNKDKLSKEETKEIMTSIRQAFVGKLSNKVLNSTDNILISMLVGTNLVGVYSQYSMFINGFLRIFSQVNESVVGSIGNLIASESEEKTAETYNKLLFLFFAMASFCSICLYLGIDAFLTGIMGKALLLDGSVLIIITINMFLEALKMPLWTYFTATGLFGYEQKISFVGCILNVITSIILGKMYGMLGIFIGTFISIVYMMICKSMVLRKEVFKDDEAVQAKTIQYIVVFAIELVIAIIVNKVISFGMGIFACIVEFVVKVLIGMTITLGFIYLLYKDTEEYKYFKWFVVNYPRPKGRWACKRA